MMTTTTSSGVGGAGGLAEFSFLALTLKYLVQVFLCRVHHTIIHSFALNCNLYYDNVVY